MVRVNKATARQQQRMIHQQYRNNNRLFNRHVLNLLVISVIGLSIALYFFLKGIEDREIAFEEKENTVNKEEKVVSVENIVKESKESINNIRHEQEVQEEYNNNNNKEDIVDETSSDMIYPASKVLSAGLPFLVYGTAWKKDDTARLVAEAIKSGFRFVDTACQPKHYNEPGVGHGWRAAADEIGLKRTDIFIQTKFTSIPGQDPNNIPYDKNAPLEDQIRQSLQVSLQNLQTSYLDSWVMHSPMNTIEETIIAWRVMEEAVDEGKVLRLGISNCYNLHWLTSIYDQARIKPSVLQNRFYEDSHWDQDLREFCKQKNIWYQSFWTLTANRHALATQEAHDWARSKNLTPQTLMYAYLMSLGYGTPLDGTTSKHHMDEDIAMLIRMQNGERIFADDTEIRKFENLLGF